MVEVVRYAFSPGTKLHKRWKDVHGPIRVLCEPHEGYVMARRPGCAPFILSVRELMNATRHPTHGPFEAVDIGKPRGRALLAQAEKEAG